MSRTLKIFIAFIIVIIAIAANAAAINYGVECENSMYCLFGTVNLLVEGCFFFCFVNNI